MNWIWDEIFEELSQFLQSMFDILGEAIVEKITSNSIIQLMLNWYIGFTIILCALTFIILLTKGLLDGDALTVVKDAGWKFVLMSITSVGLVELINGVVKLCIDLATGIFSSVAVYNNSEFSLTSIKTVDIVGFGSLVQLIMLFAVTFYMFKYQINIIKYMIKMYVVAMTFPFQAVEFMVGGISELIEYIYQFLKIGLTMAFTSLFIGLGIGFFYSGIAEGNVLDLIIGFGFCTSTKEIIDALGRLGSTNTASGTGGKALTTTYQTVNIVSTVGRMVG